MRGGGAAAPSEAPLNSVTDDLISYLREHFPALVLGDALFYGWPIGIRFDLGGRALTVEDLARVQRRATTLFEAIFLPGDACLVVSQDWPDGDTPNHEQTHHSMLSDFDAKQCVGLRQPSGRVRIQTAEGGETSPCTLTWFEQSGRDFRYGSILEGIANADHWRFPALSSRVYFVNPRTHVIMHMYDDRGLDMIATTKPALVSIYREFGSWILDYDREQIDDLFGGERKP